MHGRKTRPGRAGRLVLGAATLACAATLVVGCAAERRVAATAPRPVPGPGIALPAPNAVLLGAVEGEETARNDAAMGSPRPGTLGFRMIDRQWYERDHIMDGRTYRDARVTTRMREQVWQTAP